MIDDNVSINLQSVSKYPEGIPTTYEAVSELVSESVTNLGFIPDLYLIHNPFIPPPGELKKFWQIFERLKDKGKLKSIGVSNFRPQDLEEVLKGAKHKPVVNQVSRAVFSAETFGHENTQIEYHPYVLTHLEPVLKIHEKHGIVTEAYGALTPILRHPGGPLKPVLERISKRLSSETGKNIDLATVLLLWTRARGVVAVTASGNPDRIKELADVSKLDDILTKEDVEEITKVGKTVHFRYYVNFFCQS
jgi:diketogulonate reductase-like aldo/keto reductase